MKLLLFVILIIGFCDAGFSQTLNEAIEWINTRGEEYIKDVTGNSSLYWEMDKDGTLKITNYKPEIKNEEKVTQQFTYLNLYDLDSSESLIRNPEESEPLLILKCAAEKYSCIKTRYYGKESDSQTEASSSYSINFQNEYDHEKGRRLEQVLITVVRLFKKAYSNTY